MKRVLIFSIVCLTCLSAYSQKEEVMIKHFLKDLFDTNIPEATIVDKYLVELKPDEKFSISLDERKQNQLGHIKLIRDNKKESIWLLPDKMNADPNNIVVKYGKYKRLDEFNLSQKIKRRYTRNIYVLLDSDEKKILQYFLMEDGKIKSFALFVKSGDASFFEY